MTLEQYRQAPCRRSSLPYWKQKDLRLPEGLRVVHQEEFRAEDYLCWADAPYFRLLHTLDQVGPAELPGVLLRTAEERDVPQIAAIINASYADISVTGEQMTAERALPVFDPALWVIAESADTGAALGCAVGALDREAEEGMLEWVQVLPEHRRRGVGRLLVNALLERMRGRAQFATVSGKADDPLRPELLYRACGFTGEDLWHILRRA